MSLPISTYDSLLYTYKAAILDNWHDFSGPHGFKFDQIADILQPLYEPLQFKGLNIPNTSPVQKNIGEGVGDLTTYGCPISETSTSSGGPPVASSNEDIFLAQLGIIKDSNPLSPTYGMRIINQNAKKCWEQPPATAADTLASTHYIDFTAKRMAIRRSQGDSTSIPSGTDETRFGKGVYINIDSLGAEIGSSAFGDLMETVCTDGTYSLVADTIQKGFQWQIKQFYKRKNPWSGEQALEAADPRKGRLVWTDCAETAFDPALKSYGPEEGSDSASATGAGKELGLTSHNKEPDFKKTFIKTVKEANKAIIFPRFNTLRVKNPADMTVSVDLSTFLPPATSPIDQNTLATLQIDRDQVNKRAFFMTNCDITLTRISNRNKLFAGLLSKFRKQKGKVSGMITTPDGGTYIANKSFCEIGMKEDFLLKGITNCKRFGACIKALQAALSGNKDKKAAATATALTKKDKKGKFHLMCKRLGDGGIGLHCASTEKSILVTGDRPLLGLGMLYGVDVIIFHNVGIKQDDYDRGISIFYNKKLQSYESKITNKQEVISKLADEILGSPQTINNATAYTAFTSDIKKEQKDTTDNFNILHKTFRDKIKPYIDSVIAIATEINNIYTTEHSNMPKLTERLIQGNKLWRTLLTLLYLSLPLQETYTNFLTELYNYTDPPADSILELPSLFTADSAEENLKKHDDLITLLRREKEAKKVLENYRGKINAADDELNFEASNPKIWDRVGGFLVFLKNGSADGVAADAPSAAATTWKKGPFNAALTADEVQRLADWRGLNPNPNGRFKKTAGFFFAEKANLGNTNTAWVPIVLDMVERMAELGNSAYKAQGYAGLPSKIFPVTRVGRAVKMPMYDGGGTPIVIKYIKILNDAIGATPASGNLVSLFPFLLFRDVIVELKKLLYQIVDPGRVGFPNVIGGGDDAEKLKTGYKQWGLQIKTNNIIDLEEIGMIDNESQQQEGGRNVEFRKSQFKRTIDAGKNTRNRAAQAKARRRAKRDARLSQLRGTSNTQGAKPVIMKVLSPLEPNDIETGKVKENYILTINFLRNITYSIYSFFGNREMLQNINNWDWINSSMGATLEEEANEKRNRDFLKYFLGNGLNGLLKILLGGADSDGHTGAFSDLFKILNTDWTQEYDEGETEAKMDTDSDQDDVTATSQYLTGPEEICMGPSLDELSAAVAAKYPYLPFSNSVRKLLYDLANAITPEASYMKMLDKRAPVRVPINMGVINSIVDKFRYTCSKHNINEQEMNNSAKYLGTFVQTQATAWTEELRNRPSDKGDGGVLPLIEMTDVAPVSKPSTSDFAMHAAAPLIEMTDVAPVSKPSTSDFAMHPATQWSGHNLTAMVRGGRKQTRRRKFKGKKKKPRKRKSTHKRKKLKYKTIKKRKGFKKTKSLKRRRRRRRKTRR